MRFPAKCIMGRKSKLQAYQSHDALRPYKHGVNRGSAIPRLNISRTLFGLTQEEKLEKGALLCHSIYLSLDGANVLHTYHQSSCPPYFIAYPWQSEEIIV